jgi:hypothetical protein
MVLSRIYCFEKGETMFHELKTWPEYFEAMVTGKKTFEVRKNDRDRGFEVDDNLHLREFDPETETYTGREIIAVISYILHGPLFGIKKGYCVMSLKFQSRGRDFLVGRKAGEIGAKQDRLY